MAYTGKYSQYFTTEIREESLIPGVLESPSFGLRGARIIPEAKANFGWNVITKPYFLDRVTHVHGGDEYLCFLAGKVPDCFSEFDAEIDFYVGKEQELHTITEPTVVYVPKGLLHCPLEFRVVNKPLLFMMILLTPRFELIDIDGNKSSFEGPGVDGAPKTIDLSRLQQKTCLHGA